MRSLFAILLFFVVVNNSLAQHPKSQGEKNEISNAKDDYDGRINEQQYWIYSLIINGAIGLVGFCYTTAAIIQTLSLRRQVALMQNGQRAWVTAVEIRLKQVHPQPEAEIFLLNSGPTPALDVEIAGNVWASVPITREEMAVIEQFTENDRAGKMVVAPGVRLPATAKAEKEISAQQWTSIAKDEGEVLYARGTIRYRDIFGKSRQSTYCAYLVGKNVAFEADVRFTACPAGNTAT